VKAVPSGDKKWRFWKMTAGASAGRMKSADAVFFHPQGRYANRVGVILWAVVRSIACLFFVFVITLDGQSQPSPTTLSVCDLSKDFARYGGKVIAVRGVYYYGLRETCSQKCASGPWPSFIDLVGTESVQDRSGFVTDDASWAALEDAQRTVEKEAKKGKRLELWVTAVGRLRTSPRRSRPCDRAPAFGHLGVFPAQLVIKSFSDIEVRDNPKSPYDYSNMYRGPL
jgi:hypothetical protein